MNCSNEEMDDMHIMYGRSYGNSVQERIMYSEAYPDRRLPDRRTFESIDRRLRGRGT